MKIAGPQERNPTVYARPYFAGGTIALSSLSEVPMNSQLSAARPGRRADSQHGRASAFGVVLASISLALSACSDLTGPLPKEGPPAVLELSLASVWVAPTSWSVRGDTVVFQRGWWEGEAAVPVRRVVPTAEAWRGFWTAAHQAGVRRWRPSYRAENIADGEGWNLSLETQSARIESSGYAAYPDEAGRGHEGERTEAFRSLLVALYALVGESM